MRKNCTYVILLLSITILSSFSTSAQAKIAYVDMQQLITSMPEAQTAYDSLQQYKDVLHKEMDALIAIYNAKINDISTTTMSQTEIRIQGEEMKLAQQNCEDFAGKMAEKLEIREQILTAPIHAKVKKAVAEIAAEKGIVCVLDNSKDIVVTATCEDLLPAAKLKLGIK